MANVGYARVSSTDQSLDIQLEQLKDCDRIFSEKRSGTTTDSREALAEAIQWCRNGDVLVVTRLDRLARSTADLLDILAQLEKRGVGLKCLLQPVDTTTPVGRLFVTILGAIAEFETEIRKERQADGIAAAKLRGVYRGGKKQYDPAEARKLRLTGMTAGEIAKALGCSRKQAYRMTPGMWGTAPVLPRGPHPNPPQPTLSPEMIPLLSHKFQMHQARWPR